MASEKPEGDSFLKMLDAKIGVLQTLRDYYLKALSSGALGQPGEDFVMPATPVLFYGGSDGPVELPTGAFLNKSVPEAIRVYLAAVKKKQTVKEIAIALREGGIESTAANFETTVTGALHRLKAAGLVLRFKDGWGLAEHYPEGLRTRIAKEKKPRKTRQAKKLITPKAPRRAIRLRPEPDAEAKAS